MNHLPPGFAGAAGCSSHELAKCGAKAKRVQTQHIGRQLTMTDFGFKRLGDPGPKIRPPEDWKWHLQCAAEEHDALQAKYNELIYAVATKWPDETRHQTALRYIMEREVRYEGREGMQAQCAPSAASRQETQ